MAADIWTSVAGAAGTIVGGMISLFVNRRSSQVKLTFEMHKEANSKEMYAANTDAQLLLARHNNTILLDKLYSTEPKAADNIWHVIQFHQRLWLAIEYKQIYLKMVPSLFGEPFVWWYLNCFEKQLLPVPSYADTANQIRCLHKWLAAKTPSHVFREWERRAMALEIVRKNATSNP